MQVRGQCRRLHGGYRRTGRCPTHGQGRTQRAHHRLQTARAPTLTPAHYRPLEPFGPRPAGWTRWAATTKARAVPCSGGPLCVGGWGPNFWGFEGLSWEGPLPEAGSQPSVVLGILSPLLLCTCLVLLLCARCLPASPVSPLLFPPFTAEIVGPRPLSEPLPYPYPIPTPSSEIRCAIRISNS